MNKNVRNILLYVGLPLVLLLSIIFVSINMTQTASPKYYEIVTKFYNNEIAACELNIASRELKYTLRSEPGKVYSYTVPDVSIFYNDVGEVLSKNAQEHSGDANQQIAFDYKAGNNLSWLTSMIPMVIILVLLVAFWYFMMKRMSQSMGGDKTLSFGKAKYKQAADDKRRQPLPM